MSVLPIRKLGDPVLTHVTRQVDDVSEDLKRLTADMIDTMVAARGVGLAANQIGEGLRMAVVHFRGTTLRMYNPRIVSASGKQRWNEGCLSVPGVDGDVTRAHTIQVEYTDENGLHVSRTFTEHLARIVQHEIDHLDGVLFVSHLSLAARTIHKKTLDRLREETLKRMKSTAD